MMVANPMTLPRCPTCEKPFDPAKSVAMPFCSPRCRQIDLALWLDEKHGVPWDAEDEADQPRKKSDLQSQDDDED